MSNKDKFNAVDYTALEKMSTQELKDLLRKTFDQPALSDEDSNMILAISEVLDIRENNGDLIDVDFNSRYILDVLKNIEDETIRVEVNGGQGPCIIKPLEGEDYIYLILPIRR